LTFRVLDAFLESFRNSLVVLNKSLSKEIFVNLPLVSGWKNLAVAENSLASDFIPAKWML
jgi:hypothetical protein